MLLNSVQKETPKTQQPEKVKIDELTQQPMSNIGAKFTCRYCATCNYNLK
uniref:Uncharacterized protein n=1 Tax=Rhizophora mucronata TaxID=61149 RepID=A0A2P2QSJ0_RHIMU